MAWYNASWTYRQKVTIDATKVDEVFSVFPLYTSKLNMHFFDTAKAAAADVRITSSDGTTEVARYIVTHDATNRLGCILINVSASISISTDTDFYVYYGNAAASDHATSATYGRDNALNSYAGFYLPGMSTADITGAGRDLTAVGTPTTAASGYEGITAAAYNGTTQYHKYEGTAAATNWPVTLEALAYDTSVAATTYPLSIGVSTETSTFGFLAFDGAAADKVVSSFRGASGAAVQAAGTTTYSTSTWYYCAGNRDTDAGDTLNYVNGAAEGTNAGSVITPTAFNRLGIGALIRSSVSGYLPGRVAMAALSGSVRSADFIATMYDAWNSSTFFTAGAIETATGGTTGWVLFQTSAQTSTADADWADPTFALSISTDAAVAIVDDGGPTFSETLKLTNPAYGITIPSGHTTYGCKFKVHREGQTSSAKEVKDKTIQFIDNTGTQVGTNLATATIWPAAASPSSVDYTGAGVTFTDAKFTSSSGLAIQADGSGTNGATNAKVLTAWMQVTWDTPAGGAAVGSFFYM